MVLRKEFKVLLADKDVVPQRTDKIINDYWVSAGDRAVELGTLDHAAQIVESSVAWFHRVRRAAGQGLSDEIA